MKTCATVPAPTRGGERLLDAPGDEQHGRQQRRREQRRDRRRRLGVGVRQPVVHRRPADLGGEAGEHQEERDERDLVVEPGRGRVDAHVRRARRVRRRGAGRPAGARQPEQRDAEPERRQHEVLPGGLERARACPRTRRAAPRPRSSPRQQPGGAEVRRERHREERGPEQRAAPCSSGRAGGRRRTGSASTWRGTSARRRGWLRRRGR